MELLMLDICTMTLELFMNQNQVSAVSKRKMSSKLMDGLPW